MIVVFLHGPVASGKHTIGTQLAALTGLPLFHNHLTVDLVNTLFEFGTDSFVRLRAIIWLEAFAEAADKDRSFIFTFTPEASVDPALIGQLMEVVERAGGRVHFVALQCAGEVVLQRLANQSRKRFGKLTDPDLYARVEAQGSFEFPPLPPALLTLDTASLTAADAAQRIFEALPSQS